MDSTEEKGQGGRTEDHANGGYPRNVCPVCGSQFAEDRRFCEYDGTLLEKVEPFVPPDLGALEQLPLPNRRRHIILLTAAAGLVLAAFLIFYIVLLPNSGRNIASIQEGLNNALKTRGLNVAASVDRDRKVTLEGTVEKSSDKEAALNIVRSHKDVHGLIDRINVKASPVDVERDLNKSLDSEGLTRVIVEVDESYSAKVAGVVENDDEKKRALQIVNSAPAIKGVVEDLRIKPSGGPGAGSEASLTEEKSFLLSGLSPASFASMKYRDSLAFRSPGPGRIILEAVWKQQTALALILNGPNHDSHAQKDGLSPLRVTYRVTPQDYAKGSIWEATVANFSETGPVEGVLKVSFVAEDVSASRAHLTIPGDVAKLEGEINQALRKNGIGNVTAEVGNDGSVVLKGTVSKTGDKEKAMEITKKFKPVRSVKDIIFVVAS